MANVAGHANDLAPGIGRIRADLLANRRLRGTPILAGEILSYHHHLPFFMDVGPGEFAAGQEWRAESAEGARRGGDESPKGGNLVGRVTTVTGEDGVL